MTRTPRRWFSSARKATPIRNSRLRLQSLEAREVPATFTINSTSDAVVGDGNLTLREAITSLNLGNNSGLSAAEKALVTGTYGSSDAIVLTSVSGTITLTGGELPVNKSVTVTGPGAGSLMLSGNNASRIFNFSTAGTVSKVSGVTMSNSKATQGGALFVNGAQLTISNSVITGNVAIGDGGAIYNSGTGQLTISDSVVSNNTAATGSGGGGGGIFNRGGDLTIDRSTLSGNVVAGTNANYNNGGAIEFYLGNSKTWLIRNSTIAGNTAKFAGGGICLRNVIGNVVVQNSTIVGNTAQGGVGGGGIARNGPIATAKISLESTIVSDNASFNANVDLYTNGTVTANFSAIGSKTGVTTFTGDAPTTALLGQDFKLATLANTGGPTQTIPLFPGSPLINAGSSTLSLDQRGKAYVGAPDIGAFESQGFTIVVFSGSSQTVDQNTPFAPLIASVTANETVEPVIGGSVTFTAPGAGASVTPVSHTVTIAGGGLAQSVILTANGTFGKYSVEATAAGASPASFTLTNAESPSLVVTTHVDVVSKADGLTSLREAVNYANTKAGADSITFDPTYFAIPRTITLASQIAISEGVTISGPGAALTTVSGDNKTRIFNINVAGASTIGFSGLTLSGGKSGGDGGAIAVIDEALVINDCAISGNTAVDGGGIYMSGAGSVTVSGSTFSGNRALGNYGGAIAFGGSGGTLNVRNSTLVNNTAITLGGAIFFFGSAGGGVALSNCTVVANSALKAGGLWVDTNKSVTIESSIVSDNTGGSAPDIYSFSTITANFSAIGSAAGFPFGGGTGNLLPGTDLKLSALGNYGGSTYTIMPGIDSPVRYKGSNPANLTTDQRGYARTLLGNIDIGAVQVSTTSVVSMTRSNPNPTAAASVAWSVSLADAVIGVSSSNFTLSGPGMTGASISGVTGSGKSYTVTAATGGEGALTLNFANSLGMNLLPANLPFAGQSYTVDKLPLTATIAASPTSLNDYKVGSNMLTLTATFSEGMDVTSTPVFDFPVENPGLCFGFAGGSWTDSTHYQAKYNVFDLNIDIQDIDVRVSGGKDSAGNVFGNTTNADLIDLDTQNPIVSLITRNNPSPTKLAEVGWTVTLSEGVTGITAANFVLFNGGLTGGPAISDVSGAGNLWTIKASTGSGEGTLALYVNSTAGVTDAAGNPLAALPVIGPAYAVDHVSPQTAIVTTNTLTVTPSDVGPNGFLVTIKYNEPMNQSINPAVTFPVEDPSATLTAAGGVWLDAKTYRANYNVANSGQLLSDIDIAINGGQDAVGNPQAPLTINDLFDIEMAVPAQVTDVVINNGAAQRSRVTSVAIHFDSLVTFAGAPHDAFELRRQSDNKLPALTASVDNTGPGTVVTLTFSGTNAVNFTSLADGRYTLTIDASEFTGGGFDGDGDGTAGDDYELASDSAPNDPTNIFRLFGDINGDGFTDNIDLIAFRAANGSDSTMVNYREAFDSNGDGFIDNNDFLAFRQRLGLVP